MNELLAAQLQLPASSCALQDYLLAELEDALPCPLGGNVGLPVGSLDCLQQNLVLAVTPITGRFFDEALLRYARATSRDVLLARHGFNPESIDPVRVDVALRTTGGPTLLPDLSLFRDTTGGLQLVPTGDDALFITVAPHGLDVSLVTPWPDLDARSDGLSRAASEVVRACRRARAGDDID